MAVPLPFTVRKLLSFSMNRVLLVIKPTVAFRSTFRLTADRMLARMFTRSSALGRIWCLGHVARGGPDRVLLELWEAGMAPTSFSYSPER